MKSTTMVLAAAALLAGSAAFAQPRVAAAAPSDGAGQYTWLHPKLGMVKVDKRTNAMVVPRAAPRSGAARTGSAG